jgi:predicted acetyltransferase
MTLEYRPATAGDVRRVIYAAAVAFGDTTADDRVDQRVAKTLVPPEWRLCAFDDGEPVSQIVIVPVVMHWNGHDIGAAGVTDVFTLPSHRRQGHLRELMTRAYASMREAGQVVAILEASMAAIYQRFGWAVVYAARVYDFDPRYLRFVDQVPVPGRIRLVKGVDARAVIESAYRRYAGSRILSLDRGDKEWVWTLRLAEHEGPPLLVAVYEESGEVLGYVIYSVARHGEPRPGPDQRVIAFEWVWHTPVAHRALVQYLAGYDLVDSVLIFGLPEDDPLFHHAQEPRLLNTRIMDGALARIVDLQAALERRGYDGMGRITLAVEDEYAPWNSGVWELTVEEGAARVRRVQAEPQLRMTPRVVTLMVSGCQPASMLARNGLISCADPDALATADGLFGTARVPVCLDHWM